MGHGIRIRLDVRKRRCRIITIQEGCKGFRRGQARGRGAVEGKEEACVLFRDQGHDRVKTLDVAAVLEDPQPVELPFPEAVGVAGEPRVVGKEAFVHLTGGFFPENSLAFVFSVLKVGDHEAGDVRRTRRHRTSRVVSVEELEGFGFKGSLPVGVAGRYVVRQPGR